MNAAAKETRQHENGIVQLDGKTFKSLPGETVLEVLLRHDIDVAFSCKKGTCLSCLMRTDDDVPDKARDGLRATLIDQGYFLPCMCPADGDIAVRLADDGELYMAATVTGHRLLAPHITALTVKPVEPLNYRAGQFINLRRPDGLTRSYSIASIPDDGDEIELHIKSLPRGEMSSWIAETIKVGEALEIQGANGDCYYLADAPGQSLLLIGNGAGLAPLIGIAREALRAGHTGQIHLYHGSRHAEGLYLRDTLAEMAASSDNFHYAPCVSGTDVPENHAVGRAEDVAFSQHQKLNDWRVYLCGYPPMVHSARKRAYLMGAAMPDILCDAFEMRELRQAPRD